MKKFLAPIQWGKKIFNFLATLLEWLGNYVKETWVGRSRVVVREVRQKTSRGIEVKEVPVLDKDGNPKMEELFPGRRQGIWGRILMLFLALGLVLGSGKILSLLGGSWLFRVLIGAGVGFLLFKERGRKNFWLGRLLLVFLASGIFFYPSLEGVAKHAKWTLVVMAILVFLAEELFDRGFQRNWYPRWVGLAGIVLAGAYFLWGGIVIFTSSQTGLTASQVLSQQEAREKMGHYLFREVNLPRVAEQGRELLQSHTRPVEEKVFECLRNLYFGAFYLFFYFVFFIVAGYEMLSDLGKRLRTLRSAGGGGKFSVTDYFSLEVAGEVVKAILERRKRK